MILDTESHHNVRMVSISCEMVRDWLNGTLNPGVDMVQQSLENELDRASGDVFASTFDSAYLVIHITK